MSAQRAGQGGLGTRVALRTFTIFGIASMLPVALFAVIGYFLVTDELARLATERLQEASKRYGVMLNERLIQTELLMVEAARMSLEERAAGTDSTLLHRLQLLTPLDTQGAPVVERAIAAHEIRLPPGWYARRALQAEVSGSVTNVRLLVTVGDGSREVRLITDPTSRAFWDPEGALPDARLCVHLGDQPMHCASAEATGPGESPQQAEWPLFLKPRYGADTWTVSIAQPRHLALAALGSFRYTLPIIALLAIAGALLLSFTHIRRIHQPLAELTAAARRMGRGGFREPVRIVSDDEFASVGRALNRLGERLRRQFGLLSALAQIDRQILEHPTFEPVLRTLLPRMPRLLGCEAAAMLLDAHGEAPAQLLLYRSGAGQEVEPLPEANTAALERACPQVNTWLPSTITVGENRRGVLFAGHVRVERSRSAARRQLHGLAHRLAVALGNEDRERALVRHAYFDPLTGLPNRQLLQDRLEQELARSRRESRKVALLYVDLDHFKTFNDSLGHAAGDALLASVAARLRQLPRDSDTLARLDGDEFALVCPGVSTEQAVALASRALAVLNDAFEVGGASYSLKASIGVAVFPDNAQSSQELLRNANSAMTRAKQSGRARVSFFEAGMSARAERRLLVEQRLRLALERREFTLAFQPKVRSADCTLQGFEALARWQDEQLGTVSPGEFIPVAEEAGLIDALGDFVLRETCGRLRQWQDQGVPAGHIAVNAAVQQLRDPQFAARVLRYLEDAGVEPARLELEITESMLATDDPGVVASLDTLRASGIRIAMDDFGTGYSSMASLRDLPVDVLKVDRSFVIRCCDSDVDEALLRGLIELAHTLGKTVVAEGVETQGQLELLRELGCDVVQGYLLGRPMASTDVPAYVATAEERLARIVASGLDATSLVPALAING